MSDGILLDLANGVARVTLNRPRQLNALTPEMVAQLTEVLGRLETDPSARVLVISGGGAHFMAGGDVQGFERALALGRDARSAYFEQLVQSMNPVIFTLRRMPQPVIASVRGAAAGLGLSLIYAADLAIASETAFFAPAYIHLGATPDGGATYFLSRLMGQKRASEMALLGERIDARQALSLGIVNRVVGDADLERETEEWASRLARGPAAALAATKRLLELSRSNSLTNQMQAEAESFAKLAVTDEFEERVGAFMEKRDPDSQKGRKPKSGREVPPETE